MAVNSVWVYPERQFEEFGAKRWEVSTELVAPHAVGKEEIDPDRDINFVCMPCKTRNQALKIAKKLIAHERNAYGSVRLQRQVVDWYVKENRVAEWADAGQAEEFCYEDLYAL